MIRDKYRKKIALSLLTLIATNILAPASFALTSGPVQPEVAGFQPAGVSDMVDLFTGDFKYNIPLLDVDGYPINLNYQSGVGVDDEASWVGLGWSVNAGTINRTVRGLPDDFSGDNVTTDHSTKPKITVGGRLRAKAEIKGDGKQIGGSGSFSIGVFNDNYTGIGAEIGANAGISAMSSTNGGALTAGLGLGILSSTSGGVDVTPSVNLGVRENYEDKVTATAGLQASLGYNTRSGMKSLTLGGSFGVHANHPATGSKTLNDIERNGINENVAGSTISYNTEPVYPKIQVPYNTTYNSFSLDVGGVVSVFFLSGGVTGYKSVTKIDALTHNNPAFGFLYAENGKDKPDAMMDFIREKENPIIPDLPDLPIPVQMPDLFSFTNQSDGGQFRLYRGGSGAFFDNQVTDKLSSATVGADYGFGLYHHAGVTYFNQTTHNTTRKWTADNQYISKADFQSANTTLPGNQHVFFKRIGEKTAEDANMIQLLHDTVPLAVSLSGKTALNYFSTAVQKTNRQINRTVVSYLTAKEAALSALDKKINSYAFNDSAGFKPPANNAVVPQSVIDRYSASDVQNYRQPHHISEITVTDDAGKRSVYGIPVYNIEQNEYSFAVGANNAVVNTNQIAVNYTDRANGIINYNKGIDQYYHHDKHPAYASSFLLTAVLSPDYMDKTGDGITPDDLGTAIKFNYSKISSPYQWRTPYQNATLNKCQLADRDDDKASIVYGKKELWYMHSIETKTKIAYFITTDRLDGLGVLNLAGDQDQTTRQKRLTEIRLYSKSDMTRPIKVVKFEYNYELCPGAPNSLATTKGKLTLKKVYFEYGNTTKGKYHPYVFSYACPQVPYGNERTDRWGIYKPDTTYANAPHTLDNEQFPYTRQDFNDATSAKDSLDKYAANWHLNKIGLPTGGTINVNYESDDYAYVQNKKAMAMVAVEGLITNRTGQATSSLTTAQGFKIARQEKGNPTDNPVQWFKDTYLNGADYIYSKFRVNIATSNSATDPDHLYDYIPCYGKIKDVNVVGTDIMVILENRVDGGVTANPIVFSAWQTMKNEYPRYAYPGFDRRVGDGSGGSVAAAVSAIASAIGDLSELKQNFYQKANKRGYAGGVDVQNSYVRVTKVNGYKLGGGVRVKKIQITDNWPGMAGNNNKTAGIYGQQYDYTTTENGTTISSGVAAYEPTLGNDENPLHQPVPYIQSIKGSISNFFDLEEPFGESFFPAASVGYSKVTITDLDNAGTADPAKRTGYIVNEFYTAKDFPVRVTVLPLTKTAGDQSKNSYSFLGATAIQEAIYSQGYGIILNDMHGKPKANRVFNQSGSEISSTVYYYKSRNTGAGEMELVNNVDTVDPTGRISNEVLGRDIEFFTDFREQESQNSGTSIDIGVDIIPAIWFPIPIPHWPTYNNSEYKLFRSACGVKVSQYYGIVDKVVKTVNGSSITTQNMVFDRQTGDPVVTHSQNEFNKDIYSVNMPAYWVYKGMGGAYQNMGVVASDLQTDANGVITSAAYNSYLQPGDEISITSATSTNYRYWVIATSDGTGKILIDKAGARAISFNPGKSVLVKFTRSGFRNMLGASTSSIVCLNNPVSIIQGKLQLACNIGLTSLKVINASATTYDEGWGLKDQYVPQDTVASNPIVNNAYCFGFCQGSNLPEYNESGTQINNNGTIINLNSNFWGGSVVSQNSTQAASNVSTTIGCDSIEYNCTRSDYNPTGSFNLQWPINRSGMWLCTTVEANLNEVMGFDVALNITNAKTYYFGYGADNAVRLTVDSVTIASENDDAAFHYWKIVPYQLSVGLHKLHVEFYNLCSPGADNSYNPAIVGVEVYNNTIQELQSATQESNLNLVFSTKNIRGQSIQSFRTINGKRVYHFTNADGSVYDVLGNNNKTTASNVRNPYVTGFAGNWRPYQTKVFQQKRDYSQMAANQNGVNVKNAGYIDSLSSYWYYANNAWVTDAVGNRKRWVNANTVTLYDKYGQQLENKDALGRYSGARFDFNGELPSAVASNAMNRDVYASSFEDVKFKELHNSADSTVEFTQTSGASISPQLTSAVSHSGNYSLLLPSAGITMSTNVYTLAQKTQAYLDRNTRGEYIIKGVTGLYPKGFEPNPTKKYIFNAWVKDNAPTATSIPIALTVAGNGGAATAITLTCKAIVEGWKLVEGTIDMTALGAPATTLKLNITGPGIYIDDIRIHPVDALMKTYAYDDATMRLMAELDENCFATFYEYDDEGLLIRVKKETERGIMTLKETRSSYTKQP